VRAALVQVECVWGDADANIAKIDAWSRRAREVGADLAVFPELTVHGIHKDERIWQLSEGLDGPSVGRVRDIARATGLFLGFGFSERASPLPYNAYAVATPEGRLAGVHRKNYIPYLEVPYWQGHAERPVFDVGGRRVAVAICWDATEEQLLAHYGRQRADVVLMPHAWDADPLDTAGGLLKHDTILELFEHQRCGRLGGWATHDAMRDQFYAYVPQRAREHGFHALFVNQSGQPHPALRFEGPSFAVGRRGEILAETKDGSEQMLLVEIP
jgi:predicted amidohydrolase